MPSPVPGPPAREADEARKPRPRAARRLWRAALGAVALGIVGWGALALHYAGPPRFATALPAAWTLAALAVLAFVRPFEHRLAAFAALAALLFAWWTSLRPSNDRDWQRDVARPPYGVVEGDRLVLHDVRNFDYRSETDFTERWETREYDLAKLERLDLFMAYWGSPWISHTIMSWAFTDGQHLAVSIETRKERHESYSAIAGFFRRFELYYVAADERDVIGLRTNHRGDTVYLYPLRTPRDRARRLLLQYVTAMNALAAEPRFYGAATANCTTTIRTNLAEIGVSMPFDWRVLANGRLDELLYEHEVVDTSRPFPALKEASLINPRARAAGLGPDFSRRIREGIVVPLRFDQPGAPPMRR